MRKRITYANVVATLALVLAMSGGALAATHYLINSTKQINPKVIKKLRGYRGARGASGPIGAIGPQGVQGPTGAKGTRGPQGEPGFSALSQLPSGGTESGSFALSGTAKEESQVLSVALTFQVPLAAPIAAEHIEFRSVSSPDENCLGPGEAKRGYLCFYYAKPKLNVLGPLTYDPESETATGTGHFGVGLSFMAAAEGPVYATGTWTVTAP